MSKIAILDCSLGIAGDMTVGALLDLGVPFDFLKKEIKKLKIAGYQLSLKTVRSGAFRAKKFSVHIHYPAHHHTSLKDIEKRIRNSRLHLSVKKTAIAIFRNLGKAEARVHGIALQKVHFHEVGAVDSIVDIVGTAICFHYLGIKKAYVRSIRVGRGVQKGDHGEMPIPVPGAYELLKGFWIEQADFAHEMVTPTGAAILATLCRKTHEIPRLKIEKIGSGAGDQILGGARGYLRVALGRTVSKNGGGPRR